MLMNLHLFLSFSIFHLLSLPVYPTAALATPNWQNSHAARRAQHAGHSTQGTKRPQKEVTMTSTSQLLMRRAGRLLCWMLIAVLPCFSLLFRYIHVLSCCASCCVSNCCLLVHVYMLLCWNNSTRQLSAFSAVLLLYILKR